MISYHKMVQSYIFLFVTVTSSIWKISLGLSCLSCHSESDKSRCSTHQVQCREGFEECFFDKSTLQNSAVVYSAGCRAKAVCDLLGNAVGKRDVIGRSRRTSVLCAQCCNTASRNNIPCNAHLCDNRLFCLSCHSESDKSKCLTHQVECRDGLEECFFDKTTLQNSAVVYSAGCREKAVCDLVGNAIGKRDVISRSRRTSVLCAQCCNTPPRNSLPCNAQLCEDRFTTDISIPGHFTSYNHNGVTPDTSTVVISFIRFNHTDCKDLINCRPYPKESICPANSSYHAWANVRCRMYCGFCIVSTPPSSCVDKISNCYEYDADLCTNPLYRLFREDNCQLFCGLCKIAVSTPPPSCADKISNCREYDADLCTNPLYRLFRDDNCQRFCGLCKTAATIPSTTPPNPVPTTTMKIPSKPPTTIDVKRCTQWDNWVNLHTPDASGDSEPIAEVKKHSHICINPMKIECRTATGSTADDLGQIISCDLWSGLQCDNMNQFDPNGCADYKVRLGCLKQTSECTPCVDRSWSPWVDERNPTTYALGDKEKSGLEYQRASGFCNGGTIHKVECWSTDIGAFHYSTGEVMKCTPIDGVVCNNADNYPMTCTNYKIRYQCTCSHNTPQLDTGTTSIAATTLPTGPMFPDSSQNHSRRHRDQTTTVSACQSGWSPYINENHPDTYALGDKEKSAHEYQKATHFCVNGKISRVECWDVDIDAAHYSSGEVMTCTPEGGVMCNNADNFPAPCSDYKIRYFCECTPSAVTTASPQPPVSTPAPCDLFKCQPMVKPLLKEGEKLMVIKTTDGCCDKYTVVCKPEKCITMPPTCTSPRVVQQTNTGECCPQYKCECPSPCPKMVTPVCKPDSHYIVIDTDCNCQAYACVKNIVNGTMPPVVTVNQVCKYTMNGHEVVKHPGDIWQDGHCKSCQCMNRTDGTVETSCRTQTCPSCKLGEVHVDLPGECCGQCKPSGCVVSGTVYKDGQHMPIDRKCYTRTCTYMPDFQQYALQDTFIRCPTTDLPACPGNKTLYDSTGCCPTCKVTIKQNASQCSTCMPRLMFREASRSVAFFTVTNSYGITCKNTDPVQDLMECSGYCSSHAQYTAIMQGFNNKCNCCQPTSTSDKTVKLTCTDGTTMNKTYKVPDTCGCLACSAGR